MDEMNTSELLVKETEEKTLYKILLMLKDSKTKEELEEKIKALLTNK